MDKAGNLFGVSPEWHNRKGEFYETLLAYKNVRIERIVSTGQTSPFDFWYDQEEGEWVVLIDGEAEIEFYDGLKVKLKAGDHLFIEPHKKHKVTYTSTTPPAIWLAVFVL